jgi:hypothetical protein
VIINRRLRADSGHIVELTVPAAEAIGLRNEARVRVEPINSDGTPAPAAAPPPPPAVSAAAGSRETPGTREAPNAGKTPDTRNGPLAEGSPGERRPLPAVRPPPSPDTDGPETANENAPRGFYYTNSYDGEYSEDLGEDGPLPSQESGLSGADIVTLLPETDQPAAPPPARTRPVPPPSASLAQARPASPALQAQPDPPALAMPPAQAAPASPAQARPAPPALQAQPDPPALAMPPVQAASASPAQARPAPPAPGARAASAQIALPADTDRVVLSMNRD